jgi:hypothetical protein
VTSHRDAETGAYLLTGFCYLTEAAREEVGRAISRASLLAGTAHYRYRTGLLLKQILW